MFYFEITFYISSLAFLIKDLQIKVIITIRLFNTKQRLIFSTFNYANNGSLFFINGPSGIKKIFL